MGELRAVVVAIAVSCVLGGAVYGIDYMLFQWDSGVTVERYTATLYPNGTLVEEYVYRITADGECSMLYRTWDSPLVRGSMNEPHVELVNITVPVGCVAYVKDTYGLVWASNATFASHIEESAERNEAGCYNPSRFPAGTYVVRYVFRLHPPMKYDGERYLLNLYLAGASHIAYRSVHIRVVGNGSLESLYVYPPEMVVEEGVDGYVVEGSLGKDTPLRIILLYRDSAMEAYTSSVDGDLADSARWDAEVSALLYLAVVGCYNALKYGAVLFPAFLVAVYALYGREKRYDVPDELPTPPSREKPWLVHYIFHRGSGGFGIDGFYATLLDMHDRGIIEITYVGKETIKIRVKEPWKAEDDYERNIIMVLQKWSTDGVFDLGEVRRKLRQAAEAKDRHACLEILGDIDLMLYPPSHLLRNAAEEYIRDTMWIVKIGFVTFILIMVALMLIPSIVSHLRIFTLAGLLVGLFFMFQFALLRWGGGSVFGHWRGDHYREKLQWDAFRHSLKRYSENEVYSQGVLYRGFLPYAVALGVGEGVAEKLRKAGFSPPPVSDMYGLTAIWYGMSYTHVSSGGGAVGGGGGFGGGGAGAR